MCVQHFRRTGGYLFMEITGSKGGRDRITPVRPEIEKDMRGVLARVKRVGKVKLFNRIHSYRKEYAQILYRLASQDRALRDELLQVFPLRHELKIKGEYVRRQKGAQRKSFNRDDVYLVTQALEHDCL